MLGKVWHKNQVSKMANGTMLIPSSDSKDVYVVLLGEGRERTLWNVKRGATESIDDVISTYQTLEVVEGVVISQNEKGDPFSVVGEVSEEAINLISSVFGFNISES